MAGPMRPAALSHGTCLLIFTFSSVIASFSTRVDAAATSPPSYIQFYAHADLITANKTILVEVLGINGSPSAFGATGVFNFLIREEVALDSPVLGDTGGTFSTMVDGSIFFESYYNFDTPSYKGTLTAQLKGVDALGQGEGVIAGGTGDFRWARGYSESKAISAADLANVIYSTKLYLRYD